MKPQTKALGSQSRCPRRCLLNSSSLAAAGPGPPWRQGALPALGSRRGFTQLSGSPRRAGMLPQEDELSIEKPRRRRHTPAIGQRGRRAGARAAGEGAPAPAAAPGSSPRWSGGGGGSREPAWPWAVRGGGEGSLPAAAPCPARLAEGARLQNPRRVGCGASRWKAETSRGSFPELLAALKKPSSFHAGSLGMTRQRISAL